MMDKHLVISALGKDRPGIVNELSKEILDSGGNITDSRMSVLGGEFALMMLVVGTAETLDHIDRQLRDIQERLALTIVTKRTTHRYLEGPCVPYIVQVVGMDHPGIVHDVAEFFSIREINIEELSTSQYPAPHTGTPMFALTMSISIPAQLSIAELRETFYDFCDDINLDATLEVEK